MMGLRMKRRWHLGYYKVTRAFVCMSTTILNLSSAYVYNIPQQHLSIYLTSMTKGRYLTMDMYLLDR